MPFFRIGILSICALMAVGNAQEAQIRGPVPGFVYDPGTRSIRPILGVPGAAVWGPGIAGDLDSADVAPNGKWALGSREGQLVYLAGIDTGSITAQPLSDLEGWDLAAWSADSTAAALYSEERRQLVLATGLDRSPQVSAPDLSLLGGRIRFVLVDGATQAVVFGLEGAGVYLADGTNPPRLLAHLQNPNGAAFIREGRDIAIADAGARQVFELLDFRGAAALAPFADLPDGADPVGVASRANQLFVADRSTSSIAVFDVTTRQLVATLNVDSPPAGVKAIGSQSLFLLGTEAEMLFVLDGSRGAVYFVPGRNHP